MTRMGSKEMNSKVAGSISAMRTWLLAVTSLVALFALATPAVAQPTVLMSGLDNPRGIAVTHDHGHGHDDDDDDRGLVLYVAEAGKGGTGNCLVVRGQVQCAGATGAVSRYRKGEQERIVTGLPSYAPASGAGATGPHDVSFGGGRGYVVIGLHGSPSLREVFGDGFGWIVRFCPNGGWSYEVDVTAHEAAANPDGGLVDSNPHGLLEDGGRRLVVDAGGNSLLRIDGRDRISTLAVFPSRAQGRSTDAVPSAVAAGPDGATYVGELTGVPFAVGAARVYRVLPGQAPQVHLTGFTTIVDLAFDRDDNLYVLEHATGPGLSGPGALPRVTPDGVRTTIASDLTRPTSVALDRNCNAYVSNRGTSAGTGEVLRINIG